MKPSTLFLVISPLVISSAAIAEPVFSNGSASPAVPAIATSSRSLSNVAAPAGFVYAETAGTTGSANSMAGFAISPDETLADPGPYRIADDFTLNTEFGTRLYSITVYAYVPGYTATLPPISGATVRVWAGHPADPNSSVIYGDVSTNYLVSASPTNMLRIFNSRPLPVAQQPDSQRRIWAVTIDLGGYTYAAGQYWVDVQLTCADPAYQAWAVPVTTAGSRGNALSNAHILAPSGFDAAWIPLFDPGKSFLSLPEAQDMAFVLDGEVISSACPADFNLDGGVDGDDVTAYFTAWEAGESTADVNSDGGTDGSDITVFFAAWEAGGC